jgi:uncharacterized membrane protein
MGTIGLGRILFSIAMMGMGVLSLCFQDFAAPWQPVPAGFAFRSLLACLSGGFLLGAGISLWLKRAAAPAALLLSATWALWTLIRIAQSLANPAHLGVWLGVCENLAIVSGALILYATLAPNRPQAGFLAGENAQRRAQVLFAVACVIFGLSHFVYADFTAKMIPAWLPYHWGLAYFTGAGHLAAGIAILAMRFSRLAATLEAVMMTTFVVLVHIPSIGAVPAPFWGPTYQVQWTLLAGALTLAASAWCIADSLRAAPDADK